ncbi:hypothetical protein Vretimale_8114 [Volvox reticuliferus]|uniref:Dephospho-CoA kinase n=1 Tax=Volvox reticuliferus TaxID=1737510 RepID=A0A8J4LNW9_9CHLO|nr:hypothetical protein Vretimale_8114 [Volvox reticuliferus]
MFSIVHHSISYPGCHVRRRDTFQVIITLRKAHHPTVDDSETLRRNPLTSLETHKGSREKPFGHTGVVCTCAMEDPNGKQVSEDTGMNRKTIVLGLTGSIGMGKSTVSDMFRDEGVPVWDADATVHALYGHGGAAVPLVAAAFQDVVIDGAIDRAALSAKVVGNEAAMKQLEAIVHPLVAQSRREFLEQVQQQRQPLAVLDIPLLFETGGPGPRWHGTDVVAVVSAPVEVQRARVLSRPGMSKEKLEGILGRQIPDSDKRRLADYVIDTSTDLATTRARVSELVRQLIQAAGSSSSSSQELAMKVNPVA